MGGQAAGKVYVCSMDSESPLSHSPTHAAPLTVLKGSASGKLVVSAAEDGTVRVRLARSQKFWHSEVHDGYYGHGRGLHSSTEAPHSSTEAPQPEPFLVTEATGFVHISAHPEPF